MEFNDEELKIKTLKELELNEEYFIQFSTTDIDKHIFNRFTKKYNGTYKYNGQITYSGPYTFYDALLFENENKDIIEITKSYTSECEYIFDTHIKVYETEDNKIDIELKTVTLNDNCRILGKFWIKCNIFKLTNDSEYVLK
jgi:hypothetical protein